jgi:hypothetical protein
LFVRIATKNLLLPPVNKIFMPRRGLPMNPAVAPVAVRLGKTMIVVVTMVIEAAVVAVALKAKELFIMPYVHVVEPKPKSRSNRNKIGKFYAGIASAPKITTDSLNTKLPNVMA